MAIKMIILIMMKKKHHERIDGHLSAVAFGALLAVNLCFQNIQFCVQSSLIMFFFFLS